MIIKPENFDDFIVDLQVNKNENVYLGELDVIIQKLSNENFSFKNDQSFYNTPNKINSFLSNRVKIQINENEKIEFEKKIDKIHILLAQNILKSKESFIWNWVPSYLKSKQTFEKDKQTFENFDDWIQKNRKNLESLDTNTLNEMEIVQINLKLVDENNKTIESKTHFIAKNHLSNSEYLKSALVARDKYKMKETKPLEIGVLNKSEFESLPNILSFFENGRLNNISGRNFIYLFHLADQLESQILLNTLHSEYSKNDFSRNFNLKDIEDILTTLENKLSNKDYQEFYNNICFDYIKNFSANVENFKYFGEKSTLTYDDLSYKNLDFKDYSKMETLLERFVPAFKQSLLEELKDRFDLYSNILKPPSSFLRKQALCVNSICDKSIKQYKFGSPKKEDFLSVWKTYNKMRLNYLFKDKNKFKDGEAEKVKKQLDEIKEGFIEDDINSLPTKERERILKIFYEIDFFINNLYLNPPKKEEDIDSLTAYIKSKKKSDIPPFRYKEILFLLIQGSDYLPNQVDKELPQRISKLEKELKKTS